MLVRCCVPCTCMRVPGHLSFTSAADTASHPSVKHESGEGTEEPDPEFVAQWTSSTSPSLRLDLRCDVVELLQAKSAPQLKVGLSVDRVQQGNLGPLDAQPSGTVAPSHVVFGFSDEPSRASFVAALQRCRLSAADAAVLRHLARGGGAFDPTSAATSADVKPDVKPVLAYQQVNVSGAAGVGRRAVETGDVIMMTSEVRAVERQWLVHDAQLRQLYGALVQDGLMTEDEFAAVHAEERADFFANNTSRQQLGMTTVNDALSALVDPKTGELLPITEQVAANVFRQSPSLARIYRARVQNPEDEMVFWDAVVRRALFLSRTFLDSEQQQTAAAAAPETKQQTDGVVAASWNARARRGLPGAEETLDTTAAAATAPGDNDVSTATRGPRPYSFDGELRLRESSGDVLAHTTLDDLSGQPVAGSANSASSSSDALRHHTSLYKPKALSIAERRGPSTVGSTALTDVELKDALLASAAATTDPTWEHRGQGLWGSLLVSSPAIVAFDYASRIDATRRQKAQQQQYQAAILAPPDELRTFYSLRRLFCRHLLQLLTSDQGAMSTTNSGVDALRQRCQDVSTAMHRALSKALASGDAESDDTPTAWTVALKDAEEAMARVDELVSTVVREATAADATTSRGEKRAR